MKRSEIEHILRTNNINILKKYGQNFLTDEELCKKTVKYLLEDTSSTIVEVGPGLGALTSQLVGTSKKVILVEIDRGLSSILERQYQDFEVINKDFLRFEIPSGKVSVISNIPYYLTTPIIEHVLLDSENLVQFVFMVQKEVVTRLIASVGTKEYSPLTILITLMGSISKLVDVTKDKFYPSPNVDSSIFLFKNVNNLKEKRQLYKFIKALFHNRRKTIYNNLAAVIGDKQTALEVLESLSITTNLRPEQISSEIYVNLYEKYKLLCKNISEIE